MHRFFRPICKHFHLAFKLKWHHQTSCETLSPWLIPLGSLDTKWLCRPKRGRRLDVLLPWVGLTSRSRIFLPSPSRIFPRQIASMDCFSTESKSNPRQVGWKDYLLAREPALQKGIPHRDGGKPQRNEPILLAQPCRPQIT